VSVTHGLTSNCYVMSHNSCIVPSSCAANTLHAFWHAFVQLDLQPLFHKLV
jgi:hypothetical protein